MAKLFTVYEALKEIYKLHTSQETETPLKFQNNPLSRLISWFVRLFSASTLFFGIFSPAWQITSYPEGLRESHLSQVLIVSFKLLLKSFKVEFTHSSGSGWCLVQYVLTYLSLCYNRGEIMISNRQFSVNANKTCKFHKSACPLYAINPVFRRWRILGLRRSTKHHSVFLISRMSDNLYHSKRERSYSAKKHQWQRQNKN